LTEEEEFFAWLDDELDADRAARVAARVAASAELAAQAAEHRRMSAKLKSAFGVVMEASAPPPRFDSAEVIEFGASPVGQDVRRAQLGLPQWSAI